MDIAENKRQAVLEKAAELFAVLSTPIRLRILNELCQGEKHLDQLHERMGVRPLHMSPHLDVLYRAGLLGKRCQGTQVFYRIADTSAEALCRVLCAQLATGAA